ncbi:MAG: tRNA pseudouridine(38-40) synthase TruA [candidate division WOR-3 bacterium]
MRNLKIVIEYDGTDFFGWQYQPDRRTVQGELESALQTITGESIRIVGAGRTDRGVHALGQVASFKIHSPIPEMRLKEALNALTGADLYIREICEVPMEFHARFSAVSKIYQYRIMTHYSPLKRRYFWFVGYHLDIGAMREALKYFLGVHDFRYFSVSEEKEKIEENASNTKCNILDISLTESGTDIIIDIEGNRFLRKMVRGIVGFLINVGRGRLRSEVACDIFAGELNHIYFAPACGLCLREVRYNDLPVITRKE